MVHELAFLAMSPNKLVVDVSPFTPKQHDVGIRHSALAPWFKKSAFQGHGMPWAFQAILMLLLWPVMMLLQLGNQLWLLSGSRI